MRIAILTGREKGRARETVLMGLADGSIDILVGTHAIFQEKVAYKTLGLAVIDEQHRFGVSQRLLLSAKATRPPHLLVMTATPIPRTLTLTHYGEMDVSRIDEMPPGRTPIETLVISDEKIPDVIDGLGRHVAGGGQAYWVCPLVEESEKIDSAAAEQRAALLRLRFGADKVGLVHGRMKGPEKDAVMAAFVAGELAVLVATTVIEVGVDVANATLMIVEGAERFGLAQLHQLRGRVGRGAGHSICLLIRGQTLSETGASAPRPDARDQRRLPHRRGGFAPARARRNPRHPPVGRSSSSASPRPRMWPSSPRSPRAMRSCCSTATAASTARAGRRRGPALYLFERDAAVGLITELG